MKKEELLNRTNTVLGNITLLMNGITSCNRAIKMLGEHPKIIIDSNDEDISLDDDKIGLDRRTQADIARVITDKITARRDTMAETLEEALGAIESVFIGEPAEYPYPPMTKTFGPVSPDDIDF